MALGYPTEGVVPCRPIVPRQLFRERSYLVRSGQVLHSYGAGDLSLGNYICQTMTHKSLAFI